MVSSAIPATAKHAGILLDGLERLEYRGYDSAGILVSDNGTFHTVKRSGRLSNLRPPSKGVH